MTRPVVRLTAEGAVVSAGGLAVYKRRQSRVKIWLVLVENGDSTGRLGPENYHLLETGWIVVAGRRAVQERGCKRQLPDSALAP